jgi:hypothetical protein
MIANPSMMSLGSEWFHIWLLVTMWMLGCRGVWSLVPTNCLRQQRWWGNRERMHWNSRRFRTYVTPSIATIKKHMNCMKIQWTKTCRTAMSCITSPTAIIQRWSTGCLLAPRKRHKILSARNYRIRNRSRERRRELMKTISFIANRRVHREATVITN